MSSIGVQDAEPAAVVTEVGQNRSAVLRKLYRETHYASMFNQR